MTAQPDPTLDIAPTGLIRSTAPGPGEPPASPPARRALLPSMLVAALTLFATYGGLIAILLASVGRRWSGMQSRDSDDINNFFHNL